MAVKASPSTREEAVDAAISCSRPGAGAADGLYSVVAVLAGNVGLDHLDVRATIERISINTTIFIKNQ